ncbi:MAG TPA: 2-phospho-L-lactate transferase [Nitrososphaeraceae archaeon]|nr:2-phospho-L-lactate transferase [Nitrososphaeraceae archaeon]
MWCHNKTLSLITVLAGGTGSIKLIRGLASQTRDLTIISNVGDNIWLYGLYICPDIDTVIYGLADILDEQQGWGIKTDSFGFLEQVCMLGEQTWFKLGDRDLATHVIRTNMLKAGKNLSEITEWMRVRYGISSKIIPATNSPIETKILTDKGEMNIQQFWVKHRGEPKVRRVFYKGSRKARINPEIIRTIKESEMIVVAPANPITSIAPILSIKVLKKNLIEERKKIVAISPLIGDKAVSGPAVKYMKAMKLQISPIGIAEYYSDFVGKFIISPTDYNISSRIQNLGLKVYLTNILMKNRNDEIRLASYLMGHLRSA